MIRVKVEVMLYLTHTSSRQHFSEIQGYLREKSLNNLLCECFPVQRVCVLSREAFHASFNSLGEWLCHERTATFMDHGGGCIHVSPFCIGGSTVTRYRFLLWAILVRTYSMCRHNVQFASFVMGSELCRLLNTPFSGNTCRLEMICCRMAAAQHLLDHRKW